MPLVTYYNIPVGKGTLIILGLILFVIGTSLAAEQSIRFICRDGTKVMAGPDDSKSEAILQANSKVTLLETKKDWAHIQIDGWVLRSSLSDSPVGLVGTAAGHGFYYSNISFRSYIEGETSRLIGEIRNDSTKDYRTVIFKLSVYDKEGILLDTSDLLVDNIGQGQTKTFEAFIDVVPNAIARYKIQFDIAN
jgi:hypothetical protein